MRIPWKKVVWILETKMKEGREMYIQKTLYYLYKIICYMGTIFWGFLSVMLIVGIIFDFISGENEYLHTNIYSITAIFGSTWIVHLYFNKKIENVRIYNEIFANDADGIIQPMVIAKALGTDEKNIISEIELFCKLHLLKNCCIQTVGEKRMIVLSNDEKEAKKPLRIVVCPHCGGENYTHQGFVHSCIYCSGKLD